MIDSFGDKATADLFNGISNRQTRKLPNQIQQRARNKLDMVNAAARLDDLKVPPGNALEQLSGDLQGYWNIRVNDQWRILFRWEAGTAKDVRIADYH